MKATSSSAPESGRNPTASRTDDDGFGSQPPVSPPCNKLNICQPWWPEVRSDRVFHKAVILEHGSVLTRCSTKCLNESESFSVRPCVTACQVERLPTRRAAGTPAVAWAGWELERCLGTASSNNGKRLIGPRWRGVSTLALPDRVPECYVSSNNVCHIDELKPFSHKSALAVLDIEGRGLEGAVKDHLKCEHDHIEVVNTHRPQAFSWSIWVLGLNPIGSFTNHERRKLIISVAITSPVPITTPISTIEFPEMTMQTTIDDELVVLERAHETKSKYPKCSMKRLVLSCVDFDWVVFTPNMIFDCTFEPTPLDIQT
ncbi:hypothetical protein OSB04_026180 [Centaurea solstitialis]|uniref:Uncharacterized protein n=1 Tax=Centaurea solstitialis TaxID=347529 RepID=A0AA38W701_9ASTR|nr:hypothetical protein OSB04_026180 [Centaurea solstitialis]